MTTFEELLKHAGVVSSHTVLMLRAEDQAEFAAMLKDGRVKKTPRGFYHISAGKGDESMSHEQARDIIWESCQQVMKRRTFFTSNYIFNLVSGQGVGRAGVNNVLKELMLEGQIFEYEGVVTQNTKQAPYTLFTKRQAVARAIQEESTLKDVMTKTGLNEEQARTELDALVAEGVAVQDGRKWLGAPPVRRIKRRK